MNLILTLLTCGLWIVCVISMIVKRWIWPWRCEHCGWHEPDFRSPEERAAGDPKRKPRRGMTESGRFRAEEIAPPRPSSIGRPPA